MPRPRKTGEAVGKEFLRPLTTVDVAIFSIQGEKLSILLVRRTAGPGEPYPRRWALPGGFVDVDRDRDLESCAMRKLTEKTGVAAPYLEQLGSWGSAKRDPRGWSATHAYFALVHAPAAIPSTEDSAWHPIKGDGVEVRLAFDHDEILEAAVARLRAKVEYTSLPVYLVPEPFTLAELQRAFEIVLGRPVNKAAFRTRVLSAGAVEGIGKQREGPTRPAELYRISRREGDLAYFPRAFSPRS
jgi:ADP-ribose pyrophosphatase YjhB (NUDIX family)